MTLADYLAEVRERLGNFSTGLPHWKSDPLAMQSAYRGFGKFAYPEILKLLAIIEVLRGGLDTLDRDRVEAEIAEILKCPVA
jgi:hypothetical protein